MPGDLFNLVEPTWRSLADLDYGYWMVRLGEALEKHDDHQGENSIPPPLAGGARISEGGHQIVAMAVTAQGGDRLKQAELDAF